MENRKTVLLADANEEFRGMLREAIEKSGEFDVTAVTGSGAQIQQLVHQCKPDLVVMDVALPELDGMNALRQLRGEAGQQPRVILLSAFCTDQILSEARELGVSYFMPSAARWMRCWTGCTQCLPCRPQLRWTAVYP